MILVPIFGKKKIEGTIIILEEINNFILKEEMTFVIINIHQGDIMMNQDQKVQVNLHQKNTYSLNFTKVDIIIEAKE